MIETDFLPTVLPKLLLLSKWPISPLTETPQVENHLFLINFFTRIFRNGNFWFLQFQIQQIPEIPKWYGKIYTDQNWFFASQFTKIFPFPFQLLAPFLLRKLFVFQVFQFQVFFQIRKTLQLLLQFSLLYLNPLSVRSPRNLAQNSKKWSNASYMTDFPLNGNPQVDNHLFLINFLKIIFKSRNFWFLQFQIQQIEENLWM